MNRELFILAIFIRLVTYYIVITLLIEAAKVIKKAVELQGSKHKITKLDFIARILILSRNK